jgi:tetratricopeptide (TPR) repeat protein
MREALLGVLVLAIAAPRPAAADIDNEKADKLFTEALALRDSNPVAACEKFEQALGFNPQAIGTRLNVALCDERLGRIASAADKFAEVADRARDQNLGEFLRAAEEHLAVLTPEIPHLTITFVEPPIAETKLLIDDRVIPIDKLQQAPRLAIDPGDRVITVTAPGRVAFKTTLRIAKRDDKPLEIPPLAKSVIKSSRRTIGKITVAAGTLTVGTGIVLGLVARSHYNKEFSGLMPHCNSETKACTDEGISAVQSARTLANVSTAVTVVGFGAIAVGAYLWLRSPSAESSPPAKVSLVPHVAPNEAGIIAIGRF